MAGAKRRVIRSGGISQGHSQLTHICEVDEYPKARYPVCMSTEENDGPDVQSLAIYKDIKGVESRQKTLRVAVVSICSLGALWVLTRGVVDVFSTFEGDPPWLKAIELGLATSAPAVIPAALVWTMFFRFRLFIKNKTGRTIKLETELNASRDSSDINPDGSSDND